MNKVDKNSPVSSIKHEFCLDYTLLRQKTLVTPSTPNT